MPNLEASWFNLRYMMYGYTVSEMILITMETILADNTAKTMEGCSLYEYINFGWNRWSRSHVIREFNI